MENDITRRDTWVKRASSRIATQCAPGFPATRRLIRDCEAYLDLPHFDHMHRFLPAPIVRAGGRVVSVPVRHRPRLVLDRLWAGVSDPVGVYWLQRPEVETP